jgi:hypothetical protein
MRIPMRLAAQDGRRLPVTQLLHPEVPDTYCLDTRGMMSDIKNQTRYNGVDRRAPRAESGATPAASTYKPGGRHAAITNSLYNWHSYKNWAEKARVSWDEKK